MRRPGATGLVPGCVATPPLCERRPHFFRMFFQFCTRTWFCRIPQVQLNNHVDLKKILKMRLLSLSRGVDRAEDRPPEIRKSELPPRKPHPFTPENLPLASKCSLSPARSSTAFARSAACGGRRRAPARWVSCNFSICADITLRFHDVQQLDSYGQ